MNRDLHRASLEPPAASYKPALIFIRVHLRLSAADSWRELRSGWGREFLPPQTRRAAAAIARVVAESSPPDSSTTAFFIGQYERTGNP
jgi:hypothetical protein